MVVRQKPKSYRHSPLAITGIIFLFALIFSWSVFYSRADSPDNYPAEIAHNISLEDSGLRFPIKQSAAATIRDFLAEQKISTSDDDLIYPPPESRLHSNMTIIFRRAKLVTLFDGKEERHITSHADDVSGFFIEQNIALNPADEVTPSPAAPLALNATIKIIRVEIKTETKDDPIPFETKTVEDNQLGWRVKKTTRKGEKGAKRITYEVTYKNNKEVDRKIIGKEITKEPVTETVTQGTFVKTGKAHTGFGTWYAWRGGLFAASPWLPMGSYAKVTNKANGESVIVQINDRGPFGKNRIIDLDKVAFQKIASLGAGVIDVKVEEILN